MENRYMSSERISRKPSLPRWLAACAALLSGSLYFNICSALEVLVFSKVADGAYSHSSIPYGIAAIHEIGAARGWHVDDTLDSSAFIDKNLERYDVIVWNNTGGKVLDDSGRAAFEKFIHDGGGYVGIHMAAAGATEEGWSWYEALVGARFKMHPPGTPAAEIITAPTQNPSTQGLPSPWKRVDEWYSWVENPDTHPGFEMLLYVDERSYGAGTGRHPVAWCHEFEGGRSFFTALGHTDTSYSEEGFRRHLIGGIEWAATHPENSKLKTSHVQKTQRN
jgi:type 1 glutamine amidotransferase